MQINPITRGVTDQNLGSGLVPWAYQGEVVEGFIHKSDKILGLEWHPEREAPFSNYDIRLIADFFDKKLDINY